MGICTHVVIVPGTPPVPTPLPHAFSGILDTSLSADVMIQGMPAAMLGSVATNTPAHIPTPPGTSFAPPPTNKGSVAAASATVLINKKGAARVGDTVTACGGSATIVGASTVLVG
ncbi:PAAR domain-containing protein [Sphingomonas sp. S1-29]|uniref:PAAR domain-containing protein n=1 Tax=Sphingomonas sp. S1-29 TaxID=2991074 RepID=UPI0022403AAD|nr:PAAR domain-containing protein [Sphingomonas sp. S1-29]UZK70310.1 PAAR domain-containing protein [Sphingomonas sp. S1-29]